MRIALLSNVTVSVLAEMMREKYEVWTAPGYGAWMEIALAAPDDLKAFDPELVCLLLDSTHGSAADSVDVARARAALEAALPLATVLVPDLADLADETGGFTDERMWRLASMPWSLGGLRAIAQEIKRLAAMRRGGARKVLALDLDNTLWDGAIGEDGLDGIRPRTEFQRAIKSLEQRGVLLVALSRNNASDVACVWDDPRMVLSRADFADLRIDWNEKADNLTASAAHLNLGTDAFVFVDDNPAERARMRAAHPEVAVPDDPTNLRRIARLYFPELRTTDEDRRKTALYRAESARRDLQAQTADLDAYLKGLEIRTEVHPVVEFEFARVAQLSQKSNQFNVLTNRYTIEDVARCAADPARVLLTVRAGDRFGDQGLVAFVQAVLSGAEAEIVDWVMSCRAMNRRIEDTVESEFEKILAERGVKRIRASWRRTDRNAPVAELFDRFGFVRTAESPEGRDYTRELPLNCGQHIKMIPHH